MERGRYNRPGYLGIIWEIMGYVNVPFILSIKHHDIEPSDKKKEELKSRIEKEKKRVIETRCIERSNR